MPLRDVPLPADLRGHLPTKDQVLAHRVGGLSGPRWRAAIAAAGLPAPTGVMATEEIFSVDRGEILDFATGKINEENAVQLLYLSLAWGLGSKGSYMALKLRGIGQTNRFTTSDRLVQAWEAVRAGASSQDCYEVLLTPKGRPYIKQLGAAFATKYLYFATGSGSPRTPILDKVVANSLRPLAWEDAPTTAWWSDTYAKYCNLLNRWAQEASSDTSEPMRVDQVEKMLFSRSTNATS